jgi:glycosyltransferase involved in cell wall biosynthesis
MNVLFLAHIFPWPLNLGARQRVFHQARGIAAAHDVSVVAYDAAPPGEDQADFLTHSRCLCVAVVPRTEPNSSHPHLASRIGARLASLGERLRSPLPEFIRDVWSEALVKTLEEVRAADSIDVVYATRSWMAEHARAAGFPRIIVDVDDLMSELSAQEPLSSLLTWRIAIQLFDAAKAKRYEKSLPRRFSRVVIAKPDDRDLFSAQDRDRVSLVPNGIIVPRSPAAERPASNTLLFVGALGYGPNIDAIRWFATEILPLIWRQRPDVRFVVVGFGSSEPVADVLRDPRCVVHESPPALGAFYDEAAVVVTPIRLGGGTRIKILEALGYGRAVVSTSFAAAGLGLRAGIELEFADTPGAFAARCLDLLHNADRRRELAAAGRATVSSRFDWASIERALPNLVSDAAIGALTS